MRALELRIPPLLVTLLMGGLGWLITIALPLRAPAVAPRLAAAAVLAGSGAAVIAAGIAAFRRSLTTVDPTEPGKASALVTSGVYRISRNPMYLGFLLCLSGWTAWLAHPLALLVLPGFVAYMHRLQILPEERILRAKFGRAYEEYARAVRRWI